MNEQEALQAKEEEIKADNSDYVVIPASTLSQT